MTEDGKSYFFVVDMADGSTESEGKFENKNPALSKTSPKSKEKFRSPISSHVHEKSAQVFHRTPEKTSMTFKHWLILIILMVVTYYGRMFNI